MRRRWQVLIVAGAVSLPPAAAAARENPFSCPGEAESLARGLPTDDIRDEVRKRADAPPEDAASSGATLAHERCVTAELMRRTGDGRAPELYEQAIAAAPDEPGFELYYADYLRNTRGPGHPLLEQAEAHYDGALAKVRALRARGEAEDFDPVIEERSQRGLLTLYQEDGLPLLLWKAFPYARPTHARPGLALAAITRVSRDTNDFGAVDDARRFTSEAAFASSSQRLGRPLDRDELRGLVRTPLRYGVFTRLRLRLGPLGAIDASYEAMRIQSGQIVRYTEPNVFGDVQVNEAAVSYKRAFDLDPLFDLFVDGGYRRVDRVGVVEWYPDLHEKVNVYELRPVASRFVGPDKVSVGVTYVFMDIPIVPGGLVEDRLRARTIRAFTLDYALYRPLLAPDLPTLQLRRVLTRGWHFYGGYVLDDEAFGVRVVERRDAYAGTSLRGVGRFDFTLQGSMFRSETSFARATPSGGVERDVDAEQTSSQLRPTLVVLCRLVDEEVTPGLPASPLASLNLVVPVRHDFAREGLADFENTRAGVELWGKLVSRSLRGTSFLVTAGYDVQWFQHLDRVVQMGHVDLRMGWGAL